MFVSHSGESNADKAVTVSLDHLINSDVAINVAYHQALKKAGAKGLQAAEDLAQEGLLKVWRSNEANPADRPPAHWHNIIRKAVNDVAADAYDTATAARRVPVNETESLDVLVMGADGTESAWDPKYTPPGSYSTEDQAISADTRRVLATALNALPPEQQIILRLRIDIFAGDLEARSLREIADELGFTLDIVRDRWRKGRKNLAAYLEKYRDDITTSADRSDQ